MEIKRKNKKYLIVLLFIVIFVVAGAVTYLYLEKQHTFSGNGSTAEKADTVNKKEKEESSTNNDDTTIKKNGKEETPTRYEGDTVQDNSSLTGNVQIVGPIENSFMVRATINQLVNEGTCKLTLTGSNGQKYSQSVKIIANPQTSSCYGWDIPISEIGNTKGTWSAIVEVTSGDRSGKFTDNKTIN